jgi:glutamate synthase (NADPH/NADH) small chain
LRHFKVNSDGSGLAASDVAENFSDLHPPLSPAQAAVEAARCLYCYDAPCINACPTSIDIPKFIHQIRSDNLDGSAKTILSANIMGGTCARACPTEVLCEEACVVNHTEGAPVKIGELQRRAVDHLLAKKGPHPFARAPETGKRIAVVGAGPAGLSFAHRAAMLGHDVVVYDAKEKAGGLNEYGLAAYKMADDFAQAEVEFLLGVGGIEINHGQTLGKNLLLDALRKEYDAVFIGAGLTTTRQLSAPGEALDGVRDALDFIEDVRCASDKSKLKIDDNVVVIGGGNTAIDAAVQAKCLGARNVTLVYRRGPEAMSATGWEQDLAASNGVVMKFWASPKSFSGSGKVETAAFSEMREQGGKLAETGRNFDIPAGLVLKAIGQTLNEKALDGLKIERGKIRVDENYRTSVEGVYAGGDCIAAGEDLTVQAVEDGKRAAHSVDAALRLPKSGDLR